MEKKAKSKEKETKGDSDEPIMHGFKTSKSPSASMKIIIFFVIAVLLGAGSGYFLATSGGGEANSTLVGKLVNKSSIPSGKIFGVQDEKAFADMKEVPEGELKEGGIEGEGQFHLERDGGASRNVYMTSATIDLSQFIGRKVKVWGQTQKAQTAGWLMDVERLEVLD